MPNISNDRTTHQNSAFIRYNNSAELKEAAKFITSFSENPVSNDIDLIRNYIVNNSDVVKKYATNSNSFLNELNLTENISNYLATLNRTNADKLIKHNKAVAIDFKEYIQNKLYVLDDQNEEGNSLLHLAVNWHHLPIVEVICDLSVSQPELLKKTNKMGKTPLQLSRERASEHKSDNLTAATCKQIFNILAKHETTDVLAITIKKFTTKVFEALYSTQKDKDKYQETICEYITKSFKVATEHFNIKCPSEQSLLFNFLEKITFEPDNKQEVDNKQTCANKAVDIFQKYSFTRPLNVIKLHNTYSLAKALPDLADELSKHFIDSMMQYRHDTIVQDHNNQLYPSSEPYLAADTTLDMSVLISKLHLDDSHNNLIGTKVENWHNDH